MKQGTNDYANTIEERRSHPLGIDAARSRPDPIGSLGTVVEVYEHHYWTQVDVDWDNGRSLMLTMPDDCVAIVEPNNHEPSK